MSIYESEKDVRISSTEAGLVLPVTIQAAPAPQGSTSVTRTLVGISSSILQDLYTVPVGKVLTVIEIFHSIFNSVKKGAEVYAIWDKSDGTKLFWVGYQNGRNPVNQTFSAGEIVRMRSVNNTGKTIYSSAGWVGYLT